MAQKSCERAKNEGGGLKMVSSDVAPSMPRVSVSWVEHAFRHAMRNSVDAAASAAEAKVDTPQALKRASNRGCTMHA